MKKQFAVLGACVVALIAVIATNAHTTPTATAATTQCGTATDAASSAQTAYDTALSNAEVRARALGFTDAAIADAKAALADGVISDSEKAKLLTDYATRGSGATVNLSTDVPMLKAVLDTRLALNAAIAERNVQCNTTPASATTSVAPSSAPAAGDGSSLGR